MRPLWIICVLIMLTSPFASAAMQSAAVVSASEIPFYLVPDAIIVAESNNGLGQAVTPTNGSFTISEGLPAGDYNLKMTAAGYIDALLEGIAVSTGEVTNIGCVLINVSAVIEGTVVGPSGEPVGGVLVTLVRQSDSAMVGAMLSSADGSFRFNTNIRNGLYNVSAITFSYPYTYGQGYVGSAAADIAAVEGQLTSGVAVQLGRSCSISGTVTVSPDGTPLAGIRVVAWTDAGRVGYVLTGDDGKYNISSNLPSGVYSVSLWSPYGYIYSLSSGTVEVTIAPDEPATADYSIQRSATLSGYVSYSNGLPAPGIAVYCFSDDGNYHGSAFTNGSGYYKIASGLGTGTYTVVADNDHSKSQAINIAQNYEYSRNFTLGTSGATTGYVSGTVTALSGGAVAGANVSCSLGWALSDASGNYTIDAVIPAGQQNATVSLTCSAKGYDLASLEGVIISPGAHSNADFILQRSESGTITGCVNSNALPVKMDASLSIHVEPLSIKIGSILEVNGNLSVPATGTVTVSWSINGSGSTNSSECSLIAGAYSLTIIPDAIGEYTFTAAWAGDASYNPAMSAPAIATVVPPDAKPASALTLSAQPANVTVDSNVTLSGSLSPAVSATVSIYQSVNGSAMQHLLDTNAVAGSFSVQVNLNQAGNYSFMATWPGNDDYEGAESGYADVSSSEAQQKVTPEVVIGSSKYIVTIASGGSATVTINGTVLPFSQTSVLLWVKDPQNSSTAITINATSYSFGTVVSLDKGGAWVLYAEVPEGEYYNRTLSNSITINVTVQQAGGDSTTIIILAAAAVGIGAVLVFAFMRKKK